MLVFSTESDPSFEGRLAESPLGLIPDPLERLGIARIFQEPHIGDHILDFFALIEFQSADDAIIDGMTQEQLFDDARLSIGSVEYGEMIEGSAGRMLPLDRFRDVARLGFFIFGRHERDRFARRHLRPQFFVALVLIFGNDAVRRIENDLRRSVVAIERDDRGLGIVFLEIEDVLDIRLAPAIDRLVIIADDKNIIVFFRQKIDEQILRIIGVLILVHHDIAKHILIFPKHLRMLLKELHREADEIIEIERVLRPQLLLIPGIYFRYDFFVIVLSL